MLYGTHPLNSAPPPLQTGTKSQEYKQSHHFFSQTQF